MNAPHVSHPRQPPPPPDPDPNVTYQIEEFLDDQLRLLAGRTRARSKLCDTVETPDRRSRRIYTHDLRDALAGSRARRAFAEKYGARAAEGRLRRFVIVLDFLEECREKIVWAGLAAEQRGSIAVQDEFLDCLLRSPLEPGQRRFEPWILRRFLDEWSHRWI